MRVLSACLLAVVVCVTSPALAVVTTSEIQINTSGQPLAGATVSFSTPAPPPLVARPAKPPRKPVANRTNSSGRTTVRLEKDDDARLVVVVTVKDRNGRVYIGRTTIGDLGAGLPVNVTPQSQPPVRPPASPVVFDPPSSPFAGPILGFGAGVQSSARCDNWQTVQIISITQDPIGDNPGACFSSGFRGSIYLGYGWKMGSNWLTGIEADIGFSNVSKTVSGIPGTVGGFPGVTAAVAANDSVKVERHWDFGLRGRVGYFVTPRTLVYGTAGVAFQNIEATVNCTAAGACGVNALPVFGATEKKTLTGWTVGGGVEVALTDLIIARGEYRYTDFSAKQLVFQGPTTTSFRSDFDLSTHTMLVGIGFKLDRLIK